MIYANPTDLHAEISCSATFWREVGVALGDVKGVKSMTGMVGGLDMFFLGVGVYF